MTSCPPVCRGPVQRPLAAWTRPTSLHGRIYGVSLHRATAHRLAKTNPGITEYQQLALLEQRQLSGNLPGQSQRQRFAYFFPFAILTKHKGRIKSIGLRKTERLWRQNFYAIFPD
jgi:hypothetical protein